MPATAGSALIIACGALAGEIAALRRLNHWDHLDVQCLPPELHNEPRAIPERVRAAVEAARERYQHIFVAYADCGTGGLLDAELARLGVERIAGAHCYEFYAGAARFAQLADEEPGTFYLTDFLVRHFERLVAGTLGIDRHPELVQEYFRNYRRVLYLAQREDAELERQARAIAVRLGLEYTQLRSGYGELAGALARVATAAGDKATTEGTWAH
jgi:hypothetical protein